MDILRLILIAAGLCVLFGVIITFSWRWYEMTVFGEVTPDIFHTWIAIILSFSLTLNVMLCYILDEVFKQ